METASPGRRRRSVFPRRWSDVPLRSKGLAVIALPLAALLAASFSFWISQHKNRRAQDAVAHSLAVETQLRNVLNLVIDAERGVHAWVITGDERFLEPYISARRGLPAAIGRLAALVEDNPTQSRRVQALRGLVDKRLVNAEGLRRYPALRGAAPSDQVALLEKGTTDTDRIRLRILAMDSTEDALLGQHRRDAERAHDQALLTLFTALGIGLGGGLASVLLFTQGVAQRVRRVEEGARRMAEGKELPELPSGADEVGRLGEILRHAAELLRQREIDREALVRAQDQARQVAEAANRSKSEFLSRMSHELRTPLNAILGFSQLLQLDELNDEQRDSADQIVKAGSHLLDLINEVLDISRIETGQLTLSLEPVAVSDVVTETLDLVRPLAAHRRLGFPSEAPEGCSMFVRADRQRLKQVLVNLLANAVKYNRNDGEVVMSCSAGSEGRLRISVTDSGPGIAPEKIDLLFKPFERLGADQSEVEGTGLGLALAQRLMEAMEGTIGVDTEVGTGSTFWVELDEAESPAEVAAESSPPMAPEPSRQPKTLLYIEDNAANVKLVERILGRRPEVRLLVAMEGRLGVELAARHRPDLILLDLNLPDLTGDVVLHRIRADPASHDIPVVIVSADAMPRQIAQLRSIGASHYLTKPFLVSEFLSVVDSAGHGTFPRPREEPSPAEAEPAPESVDDVLDHAIIASLRDLDDGSGTLADLRHTFAESARATLEELDHAVRSEDAKRVRALAHRLRGSAGSMGAQRLARTCKELENQAEEGLHLQTGAATLDRLHSELDAALVGLSQALP